MQNTHQNTHETKCIKVRQHTKTKVNQTFKKGDDAGDIATAGRVQIPQPT